MGGAGNCRDFGPQASVLFCALDSEHDGPFCVICKPPVWICAHHGNTLLRGPSSVHLTRGAMRSNAVPLAGGPQPDRRRVQASRYVWKLPPVESSRDSPSMNRRSRKRSPGGLRAALSMHTVAYAPAVGQACAAGRARPQPAGVCVSSPSQRRSRLQRRARTPMQSPTRNTGPAPPSLEVVPAPVRSSANGTTQPRQ